MGREATGISQADAGAAMKARVLTGDALEQLRTLPDDSVQVCVSSPPYWALRDYGVAGQIGLEVSPEAYVRRIVEVYSEVRRVLRADGTCWVNLGDTYASSGFGGGVGENSQLNSLDSHHASRRARDLIKDRVVGGLKPKDMVGIPWRVALALQADGWYLRADIIWHKPNPMPESVTDRPTKAHEYVFLLSKSKKYFYDADAISEPVNETAHSRGAGVNPKAAARAFSAKRHAAVDSRQEEYSEAQAEERLKRGRAEASERMGRGPGWRNKQNASFSAAVNGLVERRNSRSVWTISTQPYSGAHFACFPEELARRCILAGSRPGDTVLDPFTGSGTTGAVALTEGRSFIGCELNPAYCELAEKRMQVTLGLFGFNAEQSP